MYGAILGDIIGSPYAFDQGEKTKEFLLFIEKSVYTDDTVMTIAVAAALMVLEPDATKEQMETELVASMQRWGRSYPEAAELTAEVTHNHPEGIKGAVAIASAVYLARNGATKDQIKKYMEIKYEYDLSRTLDEIRPGYHHVESCQETIPEAIQAFLESDGFEDAIRNAVSLGGDTDTLGAITGAIAEAFYGVPQDLRMECVRRVPDNMRVILMVFDELSGEKTPHKE